MEIVDNINHNSFLSIVIPTYNRARFLDYSLQIHVPLARLRNIQIFVSDNASTDDTKEIVNKWKCNYPLISYYRSETNVGPDANIEHALKYPNTEYVWLLGDAYQIPEAGIKYVLDIAEADKKYDAIVFNLTEKIYKIESKDYIDQNALLGDLGALMTCLSCLVFSRDLIKNANFSRYRNSSFIQTGIIFESIASQPFAIHWVQSLSVRDLQNPILKKVNWSYSPNVLEVACKRWCNFVFSLPVSYDPDMKLKCLLDFGKVSGLFQLKGLFMLKRLDRLNIKSYKIYSSYYKLTIDYPNFFLLVVSIAPRFIIKAMAIIVILASGRNKFDTIRRIVKDEV